MVVGSTTSIGTTAAPGGRQDPAAGGNVPPRVATSTPQVGHLPAVGNDSSGDVAELAAVRRRLQQHLDAFIARHDQEARISVDKGTGMTIVQLYNRASGELVRQIPTEEVVRIAQFLDAQSAFVDVKA